MTISPLSGNEPEYNTAKPNTEAEKPTEQQVSIYHKLDTEEANGKKGGDGTITAKEFGIEKFLKKIENNLESLKQKATGVTYRILNTMFKMVNALKTAFKYDVNEEGLKAVDKEAAERNKDAKNLENISLELKNNETEAIKKFEKTEFGLLDKTENEDIDPEHNAKAKEIIKKEENEKINKKHQKDLNRIFDILVKQRHSVKKLEPQKIPFEKRNYTITKIHEEPIFVGGKTKGEYRTETGSHVHIPDTMQLTIEYEYTGADGKVEKSTFVAETNDIPDDYATKQIDDQKPIDITQGTGDISKIRW